jgi:uncharacterized protein YrzB (UPF0473 family)
LPVLTQDGKERIRPSTLETVFGSFVELDGDDGTKLSCRILAELEIESRRYAVLQSEAMRKEGEIEVFRITVDGVGNVQLETVEDDEEWERAAEAYDDLQFGSDEQP